MKDVKALLEEAKARFKRCQDWEIEARRRFLEDRKFANADSDNGWQWESGTWDSRNLENRPCLTINKTRQHNLQIINDARQTRVPLRTGLPVWTMWSRTFLSEMNRSQSR